MNRASLAKLLIEGPRVVPLREYALTALGINPDKPVSKRVPKPPSDGHQPLLGKSPTQPEAPAPIDKKIAVYMNRAALRIFSVPSFQIYWRDTVLFQDDQAKDGQCKLQFVFHRLPEEAHPLLIRLLAAPRDPKLTRFVKDGTACTGLELDLKPDDFGGEEYDYAF